MASDKAVEEALEALSKLDRAYSPSLNRDISQTTAHPIVFEVKADRRRGTKYHLEYKHRQTEKQNLEYKHRQTEKQNAILNTNTDEQRNRMPHWKRINVKQ